MVLNPVERRLAYICNDWLAFRDEPGPCVLVWETPGNAHRLVRAFLESQKHETAYSSGDLFILKTSVTPPRSHDRPASGVVSVVR